MSLDDKLKSWREATEPLEPSPELLQKLAAAVEAPAAVAAPVLTTAVKVIIITALVGVAGFALMRGNELGWRWSAKSTSVRALDAGFALRASDAGSALLSPGTSPSTPAMDCPQRLVAMPVRPWSPNEAARRRHQEKELRLKLAARPLNCRAQRAPLERLLEDRRPGPGDAEATRLLARFAFLCGPAHVPQWLFPPHQGRCDDSDWCHRPECDLGIEACALSWAAQPVETCTHHTGTRMALAFACTRFLRGQTDDAPVRALNPAAWCLSPEALKERAFLQTHDAGMELP